MNIGAIGLSLVLYAVLCACIARIFARTGHSPVWMVASFLPFLLVSLAYGSLLTGTIPMFGQRVLPLIVLVYLALLATLALKKWPKERP